ncbi:MAG: hypothetical protein ACI9JN_002658 [Bacteroidia bacterium]|jgi:hypothetical protein
MMQKIDCLMFTLQLTLESGPCRQTTYIIYTDRWLELNVQGVDYAYTLQGWLKGVNSGSMIATNDIGHDGDITPPSSSNPNAHFARDAYGVNLGYFDGDFSPINVSAASY